jgi:ATP/maltotriose-dependent transcriptional regulator MalT
MLAMMLPYSYQDDSGVNDTVTEAAIPVNSRSAPVKRPVRDLHLILDKIQIPEVADLVNRPRITDFLERSALSFGASLISGRAITGKTYAAASFAKRYKSVAWYTVDSTDADWDIFTNYLWSAVAGSGTRPEVTNEPADDEIAVFLTKLFAAASERFEKNEALIVIDDLHHVFDAPWFAGFFAHLLSSVPRNMHLLLLCRSKPAVPLWRLRSKQVLNVIDERMLIFDTNETATLCRTLGVPEKMSDLVPPTVYGRAGKVADFLRTGRWAHMDKGPSSRGSSVHRKY